jgi:hypothetical protein
MARWQEMVTEEPSFAETVERLFEAHRHHVLATIRADGSPRISAIESVFVDGDLWLGSMDGSRKTEDILRDPRFALHGTSDDPPDWKADAKVAGRLIPVTDWDTIVAVERASGGEPREDSALFRADLTEVVLTRIGDPPDHLVIEFWREGRGLRRTERR